MADTVIIPVSTLQALESTLLLAVQVLVPATQVAATHPHAQARALAEHLANAAEAATLARVLALATLEAGKLDACEADAAKQTAALLAKVRQ